KPALTAFRFPFVAFRSANRLKIWGRTPSGRAYTLSIQQRSRAGAWRRIATLRSSSHGIFSRRLHASRGGRLRAVLSTGETSLGFSLKRPRDRSVQPFG